MEISTKLSKADTVKSSRSRARAAALAAVATAFVIAAPAAADVLVSNIAQASQTETRGLADRLWAQRFTTGSNSAGYILESVEVKFGEAPPSSVRVRILNVSAAGNPGTTAFGPLTNPSSLAAGNLTFTAPAGTILGANRGYFVAIDSAASGTVNFPWPHDAEDAGGEPDWTVFDFSRHLRAGETRWWTTASPLQIRVNGTVNSLVLVSNTGQTAGSGKLVGITGSENRERAVAFTTGANEAGYTLDEVDVRLGALSSAAPRVSVYSTSSGNPDSSLHTLTNPTSVTANAVNTFKATGSPTLAANTTYAVVLQQTGRAGSYDVTTSTSDAQDSGAASGWSIADSSRDRDAAATTVWSTDSDTLMIGIRGRLPDKTPPALTSAEVNIKWLWVTFDEALDQASAPAGSAFTVSGGRTGTGTVVMSAATATVTLDGEIPHGEAVTVSYTNPGTGNSPLRDGAGNQVKDFSDQRARNSRPRPPDPGSSGSGSSGSGTSGSGTSGSGTSGSGSGTSGSGSGTSGSGSGTSGSGSGGSGGGGGGGGPPNRAPVAGADIEIPALDVGETIDIDLSGHFRDPEDDALSFSATIEDDSVASVTVDGSAIQVEGLRHGETTVTVTARDTGRRTATHEFRVIVGWLVGFTESHVAAPEGESVGVEVALNRVRETDTTVHYAVQADDDPETGDADSDDHDAVDGTVTIPAGETAVSLDVTIHDDEDIEPVWERFALALRPPLAEPPPYDVSTASVTVTIEEGVCDRTKAVRDAIRRSLPCERVDPDDMAGVRSLWLQDRGVAELRSRDLLGLHALRFANLKGNSLRELPAGLFSGLTSLAEVDLTENPGAPFHLVVGLSRTDAEPSAPGPATVVATVAQGAPFDMESALTATASTVPGRMTIGRGSLSSAPLTVQHAGSVRMEISAPLVPADDACGDVVAVPCYRGLTTSAGPPMVLFREPPEVTGAPPEPAIVTNDETRIDLTELAAASDGGALTFTAYSSDTSLFLVHVEGSVLTITAGDREGTATVTVMATDAEGLTVAIEFQVSVEFAPRGLLRGARRVLLTETAGPANE